MRIRHAMMLALPAALLGACRSAPEGPLPPYRETISPSARLARADTPPTLLGCGGYDPAGAASPGHSVRTRVTVEFIVAEDGTVAPGSAMVRRIRNHFSPDIEGLRDRALHDAEACRFRPALLDEEAVAVRHRMTFVYNTGSGA